MSFQGDVAGIGLGELLQGLARGGKDGVLTLYGHGVAAAMGVKKGLLFLLESPEEDPDQWRLRCERAWADFPDPRLDHSRRDAIARAERLEVVFQMLEANSLHFRFEPGALPLPRNHRVRRGNSLGTGNLARGEDAVFGQGMPVEYLLLEHARISDETSAGGARPEREDVPRPMDAGSQPQELQAFLSQCDGMSSIGEIADRLGWPLRQCRGAINELVVHGALRLAPPRELLALAKRELDAGRFERAAARLSGWLGRSPGGPPEQGDAELLITEWTAGQLAEALPRLEPRLGRALARRLDWAHPDREHAMARWDLLAKGHKSSDIARLRAAGQRNLWPEEPESGPTLELLRLARSFQDAGRRIRAATALRLAAQRPPAQPSTRVELGSRLVEMGLEAEGARLLFDVARDLIAAGEQERAITVLHTLLKGVPHHREAQGLLLQSRAEINRGQRRRVQSLAGLGILLIVGSVGFVQIRQQRVYEQHLADITDMLGRPADGLKRVDGLFPGDQSPRVLSLRGALLQRLRDDESAARDRWLERHARNMREVQEGDPILALRQTLELPPPPGLVTAPNQVWPHASELFNELAKRLEADAARTNPGMESRPEDFHAEERLIDLVGQLVEQMRQAPLDATRDAFAFRLATLHQGLLGRRNERTAALEMRLARELEERQDWMLAAARAHASNQRLELAADGYKALAELPGTEELIPLIQDEIDRVNSQRGAFRRAQDLANAGRHPDALVELERAGLDPSLLLLPWRVDTSPSGATARLSDGSVRKTPFVVQSTAGTPLELTFELEGTEGRRIVVDTPNDLKLSMHRVAERRWTAGHVVQAAPVPVGEDHVVADRAGNLARVRPDGTAAWSVHLESLGGIARTPQFIPARPGTLLVLGEDGESWLVSASNGEVLGSHRVGAPPRDGPMPVRGGLGVIYTDGTVAIWERSHEPRLTPGGVLVMQEPGRTGPASADRDPRMAILRRGSGAQPELPSPGSSWRAEVLADQVLVRRMGSDQSFSVRRFGDWSYIAWEAPHALIPEGRLWVADGEGLRSFIPPAAPKR